MTTIVEVPNGWRVRWRDAAGHCRSNTFAQRQDAEHYRDLLPTADKSNSVEFACGALLRVLTKEWQWSDEILARILREWPVSKRTVKRARDMLGVEAKMFPAVPGHEKGGWMMRLGEDSDGLVPPPPPRKEVVYVRVPPKRKELPLPEPTPEISSMLPDGTWYCVRDHQIGPCGDCDGCRYIQAINRRAS